ncbi:MAG: hypothetical protein K2P99_03035 [Burkholderiales bacterium]|nr:hypothetical protein [Burkholderiales bacterium]
MKKLKSIIGLLPIAVVASPVDEALLDSAKVTGSIVYASCIATPPVTASQNAYCVGVYATYVAKLQALNAPLPMMLSKERSPYALSPYDICKYEIGNLIFGKQTEIPYCPTIPQ